MRAIGYIVIVIIYITFIEARELSDGYYSSFNPKIGRLKEIPRKFEVNGENAASVFHKYLNDIRDIAAQNNLTVLYKVKVDVMKPKKRKVLEKIVFKKIKSKKYNVPLKKQSLKLSNFEALLRKMAEEKGTLFRNQDEFIPLTTDQTISIVSPKQIQLKFKPVISAVKTKFVKNIRPVKNRIITLT